MPKLSTLVVLAGLTVSACSVVNPQIGQLKTFKQEAAARNWRAIANAKVECVPRSQGCVQLHQIKADACMSLADQLAPTQQSANYDCAITEYQAAIAAQHRQADATVDMARLQTSQLDALSRRRDISRSEEEAARFNRELLRDATILVKAAPARTAGNYYVGDALLSQALSEQPPASCETLHRAVIALGDASRWPNVYAGAIAQRQRDIENATRAGRCNM
jgi:hypothetical protein